MTTRTEIHIQEICRRARQYRQQYERRMLSILSVCSLFLLACITTLLKKVQTPGIFAAANAYGAVLLRNEVSPYIVVGVAAFAAGVMCTIFCMRCREK